MPKQYDDEMTIVLFRNEQKKPNYPVMTGKAVIDGETLKVALWAKKSSRDGSTFWSGKFEPSDNAQGQPRHAGDTPRSSPKQEPATPLEEDIPF